MVFGKGINIEYAMASSGALSVKVSPLSKLPDNLALPTSAQLIVRCHSAIITRHNLQRNRLWICAVGSNIEVCCANFETDAGEKLLDKRHRGRTCAGSRVPEQFGNVRGTKNIEQEMRMQNLGEVIECFPDVPRQNIKALKSKVNRLLLSGDPRIAHTQVTQKKPYTMVEVSLVRKESISSGIGFAKVQKPDLWSPTRGVLIATDYALNDLVGCLIEHGVKSVPELMDSLI